MLGQEGRAGVGGDGGQPRAGLVASLRPEKGLACGRQSWENYLLAKGLKGCERGSVLPAMAPQAWLSFLDAGGLPRGREKRVPRWPPGRMGEELEAFAAFE